MNEEKIDIGKLGYLDLEQLAESFRDVFISPNVKDKNMENANVVDVLDKISIALFAIADSIERKNNVS